MQKVIRYYLILMAIYSLNSTITMAAELVEAQPLSEESILYTEIHPFSPTPFDHVPNFVYANPPYKLHTWSNADLRTLKGGTTTFALQANSIEIMVKKLQQENWEGMRKDYNTECTRLREAYDWIHSIGLIEEYLCYNQLSIEQLKAVNGRLNRLTDKTNGAFRDSPNTWNLRPLTKAENRLKTFAMFHFWKVNNTTYEGLVRFKTFFKVKNGHHIGTSGMKDFFTICNYEEGSQNFDIKEVDQWEREAMDDPSYEKGYIDLKAWFFRRVHLFTRPENIASSLLHGLETLQNTRMHPIKAAAYIWLQIVRIHPWSGAHKRTGKAIASWVLLQNGYLPPLIQEKDIANYDKILIDSLNPENGDELFTNYIARLINETQEMYQGRTL